MRIIYLVVDDAFDDDVVSGVLYEAWQAASRHTCDTSCDSEQKCALITQASYELWIQHFKYHPPKGTVKRP